MFSNISTIVTKNLITEFFILQYSMKLFNPNTKILVLCDEESSKLIKNLFNDNIIIFNELNNLDYDDIKRRGKSFLDLVLKKCDIIKKALDLYKETLFVDTDIVFLNEINIETNKDLILSQHHINPSDEEKYGKYNVGYMYIKNINFPQWLNETTLTRSKFFEQEGLIHAETDFDIDKFSMNHNFGWWRLFQCSDSQERYKKFGYGNNIFWDKNPLISVHVHMISTGDELNNKYSEIILKLLSVSKNKLHNKLYNYIIKLREGFNPAKPKIIVPHPSITDHCGDTFRELVDMWFEEGLCEKEYSSNTDLVWMNKIGDILLYDRPTLTWLRDNKYSLGLFGNTVPNFENTSPWIFWGRRPKLMNKIRKEGIKSYKERDIESIFLGKVENDVQLKNRTNHDWSKSTQIFEMPIRGEYKYSQYEYLELLNRSKYGLCLEGFGKKCNREIEYFSLGVVPIITEGIDLTYYNSLEEGKHYLKVKTPDEIKSIIESISEEKWNEMSEAGLKWYEENCSPIGSFKTTLKIIESKL